MSTSWRTARVFISFTFRDMHAERDHLVTVVFPELRERVEPLFVCILGQRYGWVSEQYRQDKHIFSLVHWHAICTYLAVAITRKQLGLTRSLTAVLQILSVNAFQKVPIVELFAELDTSEPELNTPNQLSLNGF